ncbi:cupin domain-containing protein [Legionella israelensis]|uniref:Cupin domain-containing protein n=1 Tax=Legionella israelensis TaxID=454 RepID=A0AAX1EFT3_9GAMM|nr:cupin domain-containing protein [Legionella israelensis]QBR83939.1 cupin domain-containing protein [Legionella israelensis]
MLISVINGFDALDTVKPDQDGIYFAPLIDKGNMGFAIESIPPGKEVTRHYHKEGLDFFMVVSGKGILHTAELDSDGKKVKNEQQQAIKAGDIFAVDPGIIHGMENNSAEPLVVANCAPATHVTTDKYWVD